MDLLYTDSTIHSLYNFGGAINPSSYLGIGFEHSLFCMLLKLIMVRCRSPQLREGNRCLECKVHMGEKEGAPFMNHDLLKAINQKSGKLLRRYFKPDGIPVDEKRIRYIGTVTMYHTHSCRNLMVTF
jgi:hypothetical protein